MGDANLATTQYEALRAAALGEAMALDARHGWTVFLRRGMWGWAQALLAPGDAPSPLRFPSRTPRTPVLSPEHQAVLQVLATMAMTTNDRRFA